MIPEDLQVPGYDIEERIGRGGMASVYRARQHTFDRDVALKVLKPDLSEDELFCQRFVQESLIVAKLHHSNIVQVYDVGEFQNNFYIAMEYLNGGDLNSRLSLGITINHTISIIKQAASALGFAHKKGIIHRDIKPDNVMFREDGAAVLTDFGIAKELDSDMNLTQTGLIVGTPKFMSPEAIRGNPATPQSDIYSLGILLFQCLTNKVPFEGKDMIGTAYKHFNDPVPELPPLIAVFQPILEKMLAKNPEARYQKAEDIIEALDALSGDNRQKSLTNLDITKDFVAPPSELDPTIVHPHNQETVSQPLPIETAETNVSLNVEEINDTKKKDEENTRTPWLLPGLASVTILIAVVATIVLLSKESVEPVSVIAPAPALPKTVTTTIAKAPPVKAKNLTVERLLDEAQRDIIEKRLKKPDANNAFNKLERVLAIEPNNPRAYAALEQIAEEYAKLAEHAVNNREYALASAYLDHARSATPNLNLVSIIQNKLDAATNSKDLQLASIVSLEKSLMIDGLLKGAAIDEEEGRFISTKGDGALDKYKRILELDPKHPIAREKVASIQ